MRLKDLLDIDKERINRSADISVDTEYSKILLTKRKGLFSKLAGLLKREPYIATRLVKFTCTNVKSKNTYTCFIEFEVIDDKSKLLKSRVKVFCTCNDFKYRAAYILNKDNNLFVVPSTEKYLGIAMTEPPRLVKPTTLCKHLYAVVDYIQDNLSKLNLVV